MLPDSHPLFDAETFLALLFEKAPEDQYIEFRAIWNQESMKAGCKEVPAYLRPQVEGCTVKTLEASFDNVISNWILKLSKQGYDIFYGVCPRATMPRTPKGAIRAASAEDVSHGVAIWVDLDNPMWKDIIAKEHIRATYVIASGNGAHIYLRYKKAMPIATAVADSEKLAKKIGGDKCYDAPRILRVPGTRNWKRSDIELKCEIHSLDYDYEVDGLDDKPEKPPVNGDVWSLPTNLRTLVIHGYSAAQAEFDVKNMDKEAGRSEKDFRAAKELFKLGWNDDQVRALFLNPEYGISEKTIEEGKIKGNQENYLARTLKAAKDHAEKESMKFPEVGEVLILESTDDLNKAPMPSFAVDAVLPNYGLLIISGPAKSGKSLFTIDLIGLLAGADGMFMERFRINKPGPILYCQDEIPKAFLKQRFKNIIGSRGNDWLKLPIKFYNAAFDMGNARHMLAVQRALKEMKAEYIVIDPLSDYHLLNENRQSDMIGIFNQIDSMRKECGLRGVIIVHHHGKPVDGDEKPGIFAPRGSSVIGAKGDGHMIVRSKVSTITQKEFVEISFKLRAAKAPLPITMSIDEDTQRFHDYNEGKDNLNVTLKVFEKHSGDKEKTIMELKIMGLKNEEANRLFAQANKEKKAITADNHPENQPREE